MTPTPTGSCIVTTCKRALSRAESLNPDCIVLDLNLMEQSGYEVLGHLVGLERPPKRRVIVLTGLCQDILRESALALGAANFLLKSHTDAATLDLAIRNAIAQTPDAG